MNSFDFNRANNNTAWENGWCERWAEQGFGLNGAYPSAFAAYRACPQLNGGTPPNDGNYYVIYFDGYWEGERYGDVAVYRNGQVWSGSNTVWRNPKTSITFSGYSSWIGTPYLGWSEYLGQYRIKEEEMTAEEKALIKKAQILGKMKPLFKDYKVTVMRAKKDGVSVWDLTTSDSWKSRYVYKKGETFEAVAYIDFNNARYYVSIPDALNGNPFGVNGTDVEVVRSYKPVEPGEADQKIVEASKQANDLLKTLSK